jgi:hypothetical protein
MSMSAVVGAIPIPLVDHRAVESSVGFAMPSDPGVAVFELIASEMSAIGGVGIVEMDGDGVFCAWNPPPMGPEVDGRRVVYLSHMVQAGLMAMPLQQIANTAYAGNGLPLARAIISMAPLNPYVAERDSGMLADAMPFSPQAWLAHGLVLMEVGKPRLAAAALSVASDLDPSEHLALKCLAICHTGSAPHKAVAAAEGMLEAMAAEGTPPDQHARAAYGFALLSAGMRVEAKAQFMAAGLPMPAMTPRQWRDWGSRLQIEELIPAMRDPARSRPKAVDSGSRA